ncbi:hypothetical protein [Arenibacter latericius]|uniref:hypothetical protein n=1 Tax=Arenibacter latericius TaxID=86104 RepID=UPI0004284F22|nr:hypothetical protein [Arenibacter latericius]
MKNVLLFILSLIVINLNAQTEIEKGSYQFTTNIIEDFSEMKVKGTKDSTEIFQGSKITVVGMSVDLKTVYIKYWEYYPTKITKNHLFGKKRVSPNEKADVYNEKVFELPSETFKKITQPLYQRYKGTSVGVYTIPFRLRGSGGILILNQVYRYRQI